MASIVVSDHVVAGLLHVQILRNSEQQDPATAFSVSVSGPGFSEVMAVSNGASKTFSLSGVHLGGLPTNPTIEAEVDNFAFVPPGNAAHATAISFNVVFKLIEIFRITIGSVPVHASLI